VGVVFLFFSFLFWRDFLTLALKKGAFGYDLYKEFFFEKKKGPKLSYFWLSH
jgi:hypothetical protein